MKPEHINMARDAIAARKTFGIGSEHAEEARRDYVRLSLDPNCGWEAALNEIDRLTNESEAARRHRDGERDEHDDIVRSLKARVDRLQKQLNDELSINVSAHGTRR